MAQVYIGIGSNIDKHLHIPQVLQEFKLQFGQIDISPLYQTPAVGFEGEDFYNLVVGLSTRMTPHQLHKTLREIEAHHQRVRFTENQFISRTLDLDQLLYDDLQIKDNMLQIPNPDILDYAFVLKPLADIAANVMHPSLHKSIKQLWDEFDKSRLNMAVVTDLNLPE
jgi:2-amino-4-hydroxy-6-hydroxymethyldihydropteridine diphosphokinase